MTTNQTIHVLFIRDDVSQIREIVGAVLGTPEDAAAVAAVMNRGRYSELVEHQPTDSIRLA